MWPQSPVPSSLRHRNHLTRFPIAKVLIGLLDDRDSWEGTASELLSLIGDTGDGIPRLHNRLSAELLQPYITDALNAHGITIQREPTSERRMPRLSQK